MNEDNGHQLKNCFSKTHVCKFQDSLSYGLSGVFFWKNIIYCFLLEKLWQQPRRQGSKGALWYWEHTTTTLVPSVRFLKLPRWNPSDGRTFYRHQRSSQGGKEGKKRKCNNNHDAWDDVEKLCVPSETVPLILMGHSYVCLYRTT